jgi:hypothetical protein
MQMQGKSGGAFGRQAADKVDCMHFQALGKAEVET